MMRFARIHNGLVVELINTDKPISELYHPDIAATFVAAHDGVELGWQFDDAGFSEPEGVSLEMLQAAKIAELTAACAADIVAGYVSSALGAPHSYPSKTEDQLNMRAAVTSSLLPELSEDWSTPFWCADEIGQWEYRPHSASQIQAVGADERAHVVACQSMLAQLSANVMAATTAGTIGGIAWPAG